MRDICNYPDCEFPITSGEGGGFCLYHADVDKKAVSLNDFYQKLYNDFQFVTNYEFIGMKFPLPFNFFERKNILEKDCFFIDCEFGSDEEKNDNSKNIEFRSIRSNRELKFINCKFFSKTTFVDCDLKNLVELNHANFYQGLVFEKSFFNKINFQNVICDNKFELIGGGFNQGLHLNNFIINSNLVTDASINGKFILKNTTLKNRLELVRNKIEYDLEIDNCQINEFSCENKLFQKFKVDNQTKFGASFSLSNCQFAKQFFLKDSTFDEIQLSGSTFKAPVFLIGNEFNKTDFSSCLFENSFISHQDTYKNFARFDLSIFKELTQFEKVKFIRDIARDENELSEVSFFSSQFLSSISFSLIEINNLLVFQQTKIDKGSIFQLKTPLFKEYGSVVFEKVQFEPFTTYIENIKIRWNNVKPIILFRYCNLKDVYFTNNIMSYFSLHKCAYDEARFYLSKWDSLKERFAFFVYSRKNLIFEDLYRLGEFQNSSLRKYIEVGELDDYSEIASLYRRFKTSLDATKDYEQAGWFYFNEFEMKLRACNTKKILSKNKAKYILFYMYKLFTGYGEKPFWSFLWLLFFLLSFSFVNFFNGFMIHGERIINYDFHINHKIQFDLEKLSDLGSAFLYTVYKIIPINYIPLEKGYFAPLDTWGIIISLLNSIILIFFLTFIFIGLKRLFRRF